MPMMSLNPRVWATLGDSFRAMTSRLEEWWESSSQLIEVIEALDGLEVAFESTDATFIVMQSSEKSPADPELRRRIQDLIAFKGEGHNADLVADIIENALKLMADVEARGDVRVIQTAIRELRYAFKLFAPHSHVRKVTMFGSARTLPSRTEYQQAIEFARKIAAEGWMIITS